MAIINWLTGWPYRRGIRFYTNASLTDYSIKIVADLPKAYGFDIRFTDEDGRTVLPHWRYEQVGTQYTLWCKVPQLENNKLIYIYYGNINAIDWQDPDNTFIYFDDFIGGQIKPDAFVGYWGDLGFGPGYTAPYSDTEVEIFNAVIDLRNIAGSLPLDPPLHTEAKLRMKNATTDGRATQFEIRSSRWWDYDQRHELVTIYFDHGVVRRTQQVYYVAGFPAYGAYITSRFYTLNGEYHKFGHYFSYTKQISYVDNYTGTINVTTFLKGMKWFPQIWCVNSLHPTPVIADWYFIRKWHDPEPTYTILPEESFYDLAQKEFRKDRIVPKLSLSSGK